MVNLCCMRTLVRNIRTGEFLRSVQSWTPSPGEAFDFRSIAGALEVVHSRGFKDTELILGDASPISVPVAKLGPEYTRREEPPKPRRRKKPRLVKV